jgi:hypothetical protein
MPASNHSLRLTVIAPGASRSIARLILVVLALCAAGRLMAHGPNVSPGPTKSPSCRSLFRQSKIRSRWGSAIARFHGGHLSYDNTCIRNSRHDTSTTGERSQFVAK